MENTLCDTAKTKQNENETILERKTKQEAQLLNGL